MSAQNDGGREQGEYDEGQKENDISRIEHAFLKTVKMSDDTEGGDGLDENRLGVQDVDEEIGDRRKPNEDEEQANDDGDDETDDLIPSHG